MKKQFLKAISSVITMTLIVAAGVAGVSASRPTVAQLKPIYLSEQLQGLLFLSSPNSADVLQAAYGGGTAVEFERRSTFSFTAIKDTHGRVTGTLVYIFRDFDADFKVHMKLDCMTVEGNRAKLSGLITQISANFPLPPFLSVGSRGSFEVEDNGTANPGLPDRYSDVHFFQATCDDDNDPYVPLDGNIVVVP